MSKLIAKLFLSAIIASIAILWVAEQGLDVFPAWKTITRVVSAHAVLLYIGLFSAFHLLRAWRWNFLLSSFARVGSRTMMDVALAGFMAIQMMPLRTGEVARPYWLDKYAGISKSALFGTIAIERVIDGLMVSLLLTAALFTVPASKAPYIWGLRLLPPSIFAGALFLLVAFYKRPQAVRRVLEVVVGFVSKRLAAFAVGVLERFHVGLAALPDRRRFWAFVGVTLLYWGINATAFYHLAVGCGLDLPFVGAVAGMGCLAVGILLPAGPGYFGNFQVAVLAAVELFLPVVAGDERVAVFVFLLYFLQTVLTILFGFYGGWGLLRRPAFERGSCSELIGNSDSVFVTGVRERLE